MNVDESVVSIIVDYLTAVKENTGNEHDLANLISYVDYKNRCIPTLEEVLEGLHRVENMCLIKRDGMIYFSRMRSREDSIDTLSEADLRFAFNEYRE